MFRIDRRGVSLPNRFTAHTRVVAVQVNGNVSTATARRTTEGKTCHDFR
jgi:hypothetical protein